ncbi:ATP/GTP-binding protein [Streptomyces phaeofaciens]|uniref:ATP/GTP-binding protein n=1 Tax=Streptomyces phaeofaciens TaxID=68254 RepID=A0A918HQC8_9ACTN|nr:ATP/GTP-binding protein [Streptomyces phaeofaciens]GGT96015.1 ATP/GTP-binding protein [Streptomyces phaeofaciens]
MLTRPRTAAAVGLAVLAVIGAAPTALADGPGGGVECDVFICEVEADAPGQAGSSTGGQAGSEPQGGSESGTSSNPWTCVYEPLSPQPPAESLDWEGHTPGDGAVYQQTCHYLDSPHSVVRNQWLADPPPAAASVDPAVLAQRAVDSMKLAGPDIASPRATGKYLVGMPMWMWVNQSATTYGPNTASASAGGVTVTATAKVSKIVWTMGDGTAVTCHGPGTPYTAASGKSDSPTCGHTYSRASADQPGGRYPVTATSTWTINWQITTGGGGQAGQLTENRQTQTQIPLAELQVLN